MLIIVSVLIGLGFLSLILFLMLVWSIYWPIVVGRLVNSASKLVRVNGRDYYQLHVSYVFQVESEQYESRSIMFLGGGLHKDELDALKQLEDINRKPFVVHYCPWRPTWSYLQKNKVLMVMMPLCSLISLANAFLFYILFVGE